MQSSFTSRFAKETRPRSTSSWRVWGRQWRTLRNSSGWVAELERVWENGDPQDQDSRGHMEWVASDFEAQYASVGPFNRKESTLNQAWAGDEKAFQKDSKFCTFLVAFLTQKNLSSEMSSTYMRFLKENPLPPAELRRREGSPQKRWHLGWWKDFFIFCWLGSSWRLGIEFEENIPKTLKLESKSRMETNVVFPGLEGAWTEILPKIRDVKIVPGDFKAVTTCRWSHRSAYHQQLFQKVSRITIPKKGHPKVTSRIARLYKWNCPYITYQKTGEGCIPPPGFCLGCLHFLGGVPSKLSQDLMDFSGRKKRVYDQTNPCESQLPHNPPSKELEEFFGWWRNLEKKMMFFLCVSIEA